MGKALVTLGGIQFFDNNGDPLNGGKVYAYQTGTSTPSTTYQDAALSTPHANPIVLDAYGRPPSNAIWVNEEVDLEVQTSAGVSLFTVDNFNLDLAGFGGMATKNANVLVKTTTYSVAAADDGKLVVASGSSSWTLSLLAAATAGDGFWFSTLNNGTGVITIDADGAETINGSATITCGPGEGAEFRCDGSNWHAIRNGAVQKLASGTFSGGSVNVLSQVVTAFRKLVMVIDGVVPGTNNTDLYFRLSDDGSTFEADASDYAWAYHSFAEGAAGTQVGDADDSEIEMFPGMGNQTGEQVSGEISIYNPAGTGVTQVIWQLCGQTETPNFVTRFGAGQLQAAGATPGFQLLPSSGTWNAGNYTLYGWRA